MLFDELERGDGADPADGGHVVAAAQNADVDELVPRQLQPLQRLQRYRECPPPLPLALSATYTRATPVLTAAGRITSTIAWPGSTTRSQCVPFESSNFRELDGKDTWG